MLINKYLKTADSEWYKQRIIGVILCALAAFAILMTRLIFLQVVKGEDFRRLSDNNSIRLQSIDPPRGIIFDRNGERLVDNRPAFDVSIIPIDAKPVEHTIGKLSAFMASPAEELMAKVADQKGIKAYQPIILKQDIGRDTLAVVEVHRYDLPGVKVNVNPRRNYLYRFGASHLLGYLGEINPDELKSGKYPDCRSGDLIGKYGVEKTYDAFLRGKRGGRQVEVNATGQVMRVLETVKSRPGYNLRLTIDRQLQHKAEELLTGVAGAAVAIDPANGQVLAMASSPAYDQNTFVGGITHEQWNTFISDPQKPLTSRALQGEYPPASTYKIVTAIAGLEEGAIDVNTTYFCPGHYKFGNRTYRCWKKGGHGTVNVVDAIEQSCDVYFYQVGLAIGVDRLAHYAKAMGLGAPTKIDLEHEARGLIPTNAWKKDRTGIPWQEGETLSVAIGQGFNLVTPLQMAVLMSTVFNGGIQYRPQLLKQIRSVEERVIKTTVPEIVNRLSISPETMALVHQGLYNVVNGEKGTARGSKFPGLSISGKTGTGQVVSRKDDEDEEEIVPPDHLIAHAWFVAYAPTEQPRIAVAVVVEHGEHGSGAAAPIAREMLKTYLLNIRQESQSKMVAIAGGGNQ